MYFQEAYLKSYEKSLVTGKRIKITPIFKKGKKGKPLELQTGQPYLRACEHHGADPHRSNVNK